MAKPGAGTSEETNNQPATCRFKRFSISASLSETFIRNRKASPRTARRIVVRGYELLNLTRGVPSVRFAPMAARSKMARIERRPDRKAASTPAQGQTASPGALGLFYEEAQRPAGVSNKR